MICHVTKRRGSPTLQLRLTPDLGRVDEVQFLLLLSRAFGEPGRASIMVQTEEGSAVWEGRQAADLGRTQ